MRSQTTTVSLLVLVLLAGCMGEVEGEPAVGAFHEELGRKGVSRVVIARMFQRENWTIPAANDYLASELPGRSERRIQYVCDAIAPLRPTYVSGLVRLDADQTITDEQAEIFVGVKRCIRDRVDHPVRFDVVLNALHYTDPREGVDSRREGLDRLEQRVRSVNARLGPDGFFFDFYSNPWTERGTRFHADALAEGIRFIHRQDQFVGGNVFRGHAPPGSDFVAITDRGGRDNVAHNMARLRDGGVPVLMHIRNDPHIDGSEGRRWNERDRRYRRRILRRHVKWDSLGYEYMYPVFFPLRPGRISYDAVQDGMIDRMRDYMSRGEARRRALMSTSDDAEPTVYDADDDGMVAIHRAYNDAARQHLYSTSLLELEDAGALTVEVEEFFSLARNAAAGTAAFHRCYLGHGDHLLTTHPGCEGAPGAAHEGVLGHIATEPLEGTVPLHRLFHGSIPSHFYTTSADERDFAVSLGFTYEGIAGWVWDEWGFAVPDAVADVVPERTAVHRAYHPRAQKHLYSVSLEEIAGGHGLTLEAAGYFFLERSRRAGTVPLTRCYLGDGWHLLTTAAACEGAPHAVEEGVLGFIATTHEPGTVPLYRLFRPEVRDHFYTVSAAERDYAVTLGYRPEGVSGWVHVSR